jgi:hypothetical protein
MGENDGVIGELKGLYVGLQKTVDRHDSDLRNIFDLMRAGFAASQNDRESLGRTLGAKIDELAEHNSNEMRALEKIVNNAQGSVSAYSWLINIAAMLCGGCLVGIVVHAIH